MSTENRPIYLGRDNSGFESELQAIIEPQLLPESYDPSALSQYHL